MPDKLFSLRITALNKLTVKATDIQPLWWIQGLGPTYFWTYGKAHRAKVAKTMKGPRSGSITDILSVKNQYILLNATNILVMCLFGWD